MKLVYEGNELSFLFPEVAKEWHPTKNGDLDPYKISSGSEKRVWWLCEVCGYEWGTVLYSRTSGGHGCPNCAKESKL